MSIKSLQGRLTTNAARNW